MQVQWLVQTIDVHPALAAGAPAAGWLSEAEATAFARLATAKRRRDWLLGRWTVKRLVQAWLAQRGVRLSLDAIVIDNRPSGAPFVRLPHAVDLEPIISISHSGDLGLAALLPTTTIPLGTDAEQVVARAPAFIETFFTSAEADAWSQAPPAAQPRLATTIWSAKEAVVKAVQTGLRIDTREVTCLPRGDAAVDAWQPVDIRWARPVSADGAPWPALEGWWRPFGAYVLTLVAGLPASV